MNRYLIVTLVVCCLASSWAVDHYHGKYLKEQKRADVAEMLVEQRQQTINDMQARQGQLVELDRKHTQELFDANNQIDALQHDVTAGRMQLQLNARCPTGVPEDKTTGTARVDATAGARLTPAAIRDYYTLRKRIETARQQIEGLQDYIRQQCLN